VTQSSAIGEFQILRSTGGSTSSEHLEMTGSGFEKGPICIGPWLPGFLRSSIQFYDPARFGCYRKKANPCGFALGSFYDR
jgi:hypothetical protein